MEAKELAQIREWCVHILHLHASGDSAWADSLCAYVEALPTHSVRSQMLTLVHEVEYLQGRERASQQARAQLEQARAESAHYEQKIDWLREWAASGLRAWERRD